ncbi:glycosyltransferase [Microbacterium aurantiacum]|nr:glycosyltransferase [Microbacterium aurantiacum]
MLLVTAGSRGDVEPFVALARAAQRAGHTVRVVAPDNSGVAADGVDVVSLGVDYSHLIQAQGVSVRAAIANYRRAVKPAMRKVIVEPARIARDFRPDVVVAHPKVLSAPLIGEALGIPHVLVEMVPAVTPTRAFAAAGTVTADLGPLNRLTYRAASGAAALFRRDLREASALLGIRMPRRMAPPTATLLPVSPALLSRPDDWPASAHLTGPWRDQPPASVHLPAEVDAFLAAGPFVYAGFGSMAAGDPHARGRIVAEAARRTGHRLLIATGLGGLAVADDLRGDDLLVVDAVSHELVLPRASAAIHHGGVGTVHAALRAGVVSVVVPFIADQPFWGALLHRRGLGPAPIPARRLTTDRLARALGGAPHHADAVAEVATRMRDDRGTDAALEVIAKLG